MGGGWRNHCLVIEVQVPPIGQSNYRFQVVKPSEAAAFLDNWDFFRSDFQKKNVSCQKEELF